MKPHVRAIAFDRKGERLYIGIEVGGVLVSYDGGASFDDRSHGADEDIHAIYVAPDNPDNIFAATGGGFYESLDSGSSWRRLISGLDRWYMVPLVFVSDDPDFSVLARETDLLLSGVPVAPMLQSILAKMAERTSGLPKVLSRLKEWSLL